jgi:hypothetical protein
MHIRPSALRGRAPCGHFSRASMCLFHDATVFGCLHGAFAWLTAGRMLSSEGRRKGCFTHVAPAAWSMDATCEQCQTCLCQSGPHMEAPTCVFIFWEPLSTQYIRGSTACSSWASSTNALDGIEPALLHACGISTLHDRHRVSCKERQRGRWTQHGMG